MKKGNIIFVCFVLLVAGVWFLMAKPTDKAGDKWAEVMVDGQLNGRYPLFEDCELNINDKNRLVIKDGTVDMTDANCPDKICVHHQPISKIGETIVCLPNRVVVTITGQKDEKIDIIVQ